MKLSKKIQLQLTLQKLIFLLLFISSIGMLAWISDHYTYQFDLTANKRHSLSEDSFNLLSVLDKPITVNAYTTDDITRQAISEIISRYKRIKPDFNVAYLNPDINIKQAHADGIVMNKPFAFVIHYNNRMEHIDSLSEQAISNALLRLNRRDNQQVVFLSGHGERDISNKTSRNYSKLKQQLSEMGFNLQTINLIESPLPTQTKLLVIAAPEHDYLENETKQINNYLSQGGNLLWLSDPVSNTNDGANNEHGLKSIATSFGLQLQAGVIVDNNTSLRQTLNIQHPAIIPVTEYFSHIITNTIRYNTLFSFSRGISPLTNENTVNNWTAEALFNSFGKSWSEIDELDEDIVYNSAAGDIAGPITIAVALHRKTVNQSDSSLPASSNSSQRAVVIGDSDFLSNAYIGVGANLNLGLNIFNWLIGDDDFVSVEIKASPDTKLELNETQLMIIGFGFFLIIPALLLIIGFSIRHKRTRK